ncbi:GTPase family protein [Citrobacter braakii]|uniref:hypothetical protein n=1 Tax=Citrobacter braakii TaxID=57706 RepID=UPI001906264F|nr:hypothetical protein [Citrobacter braakii]MBJ8993959.1 hypothetical protein [Citrobacter braakii]
MPGVFQIDQTIIKSLDDKIARELIARLCRAELRKQALPDYCVTWGGDQRAKDGGVDVRVDCATALISLNFIKANQTIFQVKAEKFPPAKIMQEMAPRGDIRDIFHEISQVFGAYVIVSTKDDISDEGLRSRRNAIQECLARHGLDLSVTFDFYDSRRVADWVEEHPSVMTWLRYCINQPLRGWRPYGAWAYDEENVEAEYLLDDRTRVFMPDKDEGSNVSEAISILRSQLSRYETASIRIVGLSGVGKTRLVQALFDARICPDVVCPHSDHVVYTDLGDEPDPAPQIVLEQLVSMDSSTIVIVDNCGIATHNKLTSYLKNKTVNIKLITIEYDIQDDIPERTSCYRLEGTTPEVIFSLVKKKFPQLSTNDIERIADFSDGNARVAFALASTVEYGNDLSQLRERELFERLFRQKNDHDDSLLRCAEAASILYSFDGEDLSNNGELAKLAGLAEVSPLAFSRHMAELKRRGLLQSRAKWRALLPHAVANRLVVRVLETVPAEHLIQVFIEQSAKRIARSFTRRLSFLHNCQEAVRIAEKIMSASGYLGDSSKLGSYEKQMVANLAPVNPSATLNVISRFCDESTSETHEDSSREYFARLVKSIAYETIYFNDAVLILKKLYLSESKEKKQKEMRKIISSLFFCHLSGTEVGPLERLGVVNTFLSSTNKDEYELGIDLLITGLKTQGFNAHYSFSFGARSRDYGWSPRSEKDFELWFCTWFERALSIGEQISVDGKRVREEISQSLRVVWGVSKIETMLIHLAEKFRMIDGWPEAWLRSKVLLKNGKNTWSDESVENLKKFEILLRPDGLISKVRARITARGGMVGHLEEGMNNLSYEEKRILCAEKTELLGLGLAADKAILKQLLPELCEYNKSGLYELGLGIGKSGCDVDWILQEIRVYLANDNDGQVNLSLLNGIINNWKVRAMSEVEEFLDRAVYDSVWNKRFVEIQGTTFLNANAFKRLRYALELGACPSYQFSYLANRGATDYFTVAQIEMIVSKLCLKQDNAGIIPALNILSVMIYNAKNYDHKYNRELVISIGNFLSCMDWGKVDRDDSLMSHDVCEILRFFLTDKNSETFISDILNKMMTTISGCWYRFDELLKSAITMFFKHYPVLSLDIICKPDEDGKYGIASELTSASLIEREQGGALESVPAEILIEWCNKDKESESRLEFVAGGCKLIESFKDGDRYISNTAINILKCSSNKPKIMSCFIGRLFPSSWSGSLANILESYLPLLDDFIIAGDEITNSAVEEAKKKVMTWIASERCSENERNNSQNLSFE